MPITGKIVVTYSGPDEMEFVNELLEQLDSAGGKLEERYPGAKIRSVETES